MKIIPLISDINYTYYLPDNLKMMTKKLLQVGLVGTGYAAKKRAEAFQAGKYAQLIAVSGNNPENTRNFCQTYHVDSVNSWQDLIDDDNLDLICVCNLNRDHASITRRALTANKHVIVEYPLALNGREGQDLINLAQNQNKLLHIEHIEILGGLHQAVRNNLANIGNPFFARYTTIAPKNPAPRRWNYHYHQYGFPLIAALSRIHRFTDLFGDVHSVSCQARFWDAPEWGYFTSCLCQAQLRFTNGLIGEITYGKGENFTSANRTLEIYGDRGKLVFEGEKGILIKENKTSPIEVGGRRGLFAKDTNLVLEHLLENKPLYVKSTASLYALKVADAAFQSAQTGTTIELLIDSTLPGKVNKHEF
jgi:biliverdin reductase